MATKSMAYDHATYIARQGVIGSPAQSTAGAASVFSKFVAFTGMLAFSAQLTTITAGTATTNSYNVLKVSGTATSTLATGTLGTQVAGSTTNIPLSTSAGGVALLQGDVLELQSGADVVSVVVAAFEVQAAPLANVTV